MRVKEVLEFNRDAFFDGAVQIEWYYDENRRKDVAKSYVFHSKEYHGVDNRKLIDTASYVKKIVEKLYEDKLSNRFILTIAGYGTGKSHLGVTLATLLGEEGKERDLVLEKIKEIDEDSYSYISKNLMGKNLILALNGMKDFNLNYQILKVAKTALKKHGVDYSFLKDMTNAYEVAEHFLSNQFEKFEDSFLGHAKNFRKYSLSQNLKEDLKKNLRDDIKAYDIVNKVYKEVTSNYIKWDEGISAGEIINKLNKHMCVDNNIFDNIVILFDEFGRFIEYAGEAGTLAGESGLQQIFESVQNANSNVMFIGLIQSDLNAYLSRTNNSSNIIRYVGRYESSEKLYISSNLETILANLIIKKDEGKFESIISNKLNREDSKYYKNLFSLINRWLPNSNIVWKNKNLYNKIVVEGTYPLNPLTVWLLCNSSDWMQQRSTLTFAEEVFERYKNKDIFSDGHLQVYATELIDSKFFDELLQSEEKGIKNSQHCMIYKNLISLYEEKLTEDQIKILQGILVMNIAKFKFFDKSDNISGLKYITGIYQDSDKLLNSLEDDFGMISYDENIKRYEFIASGNGINEFKKVYFKYKVITRLNSVNIIDEEIRKNISLDNNIDTKFSIEKGIKTKEWVYERKFIDIKEFNEDYMNSLLSTLKKAIYGEKPRGIYLWIYCDSENYNIEKIKKIISSTNALESGVIISIINDAKDELKESIREVTALNKFSIDERNKYNKIYIKKIDYARKKATRIFTMLASKRMYYTEDGINIIRDRSMVYCNKIFDKIYYKAIPFMFDGFSNKSTSKAQKLYKDLVELLINERYKNSQTMITVQQDVKNRLCSMLREDYISSWGIFDKDYKLIIPKNQIVNEIGRKILEEIEVSREIKGIRLLGKYLKAPYGLNLYQLNLIIVYLLIENKNLKLIMEEKNVKKSDIVYQISNKLNLDYILKCSFMIEEMDIKERLEKLIKEIKFSKYPEKSLELSNKLNAISNEYDIPEEFEEELYFIKEKLDYGISINRVLINEFNELEDNIKNIESKFELLRCFKIFSDLISLKNKKLEKKYEVSNEFKNNIIKKEKELIEIIRFETPEFIEKLNFSIKEVSEYKSKYGESCVKNLRKIKEDELADKLEVKVESIIENIEKEQRFKGITDSLRNLKLKIKSRMKYLEVEEAIIELEAVEGIINKETLPASLMRKFEEDIFIIENELLGKKTKQLELVNDISSNINKIESEGQLKDILYKINNVLELGINTKEVVEFKSVKEEIELYNTMIEEFKFNVNGWRNLETMISDLRKEFKATILIDLVEKNINNMVTKLNDKDKIWRKQNIELNINDMTLEECIQLKDRIEKVPEFIKQDTKDLLDYKKKEIELKVAECRVEGVIAIFNNLTEEEKRLFLKKINI